MDIKRVPLFLAVALCLVVGGRVSDLRALHAEPPYEPLGLPAFPNCDGGVAWTADWSPEFRGGTNQFASSYVCDGVRTHVYVVEYAGVASGREAVNELNHIVPHDARRKARETKVTIGDLTVIQTDLTLDAQPVLVWSWYAVGERSAATGVGVKLLEAWNALRFRPVVTRAFVVAVDAHNRVHALEVLGACGEYLGSWVGEVL